LLLISSEKRILCREAAESGFIALITCDDSSESAKHAEPDEAQTPSKGATTAESDVDVYLAFAKGRKTYDNFFAIYELLEGIFGRSIDLVTDGSLSERKAPIILPTVRYAIFNAFPSGSELRRSRSREILKRQRPIK
jgi:hypothetical protein